MVGIRCSKPLKDNISLICFVIPVIIPKKDKIRTGCHENASVPKFKTKRVVHLGKFNYPVSFTIIVIIGKNQKSIIHFLQWFPHGIGRPGSCPQPTFRIDLHLNRIDQLRKLLLISKKINLKAVTNRKSLTAFFRA